MKVTFVKVEGGFAFEVRGANGRLIATSVPFRRRLDARNAYASMRLNLAEATVTEKETDDV